MSLAMIVVLTSLGMAVSEFYDDIVCGQNVERNRDEFRQRYRDHYAPAVKDRNRTVGPPPAPHTIPDKPRADRHARALAAAAQQQADIDAGRPRLGFRTGSSSARSVRG